MEERERRFERDKGGEKERVAGGLSLYQNSLSSSPSPVIDGFQLWILRSSCNPDSSLTINIR